jgi:hypothetical protein
MRGMVNGSSNTTRIAAPVGLFLICLVWKFALYPLFMAAVTLYSLVAVLMLIRGFSFPSPSAMGFDVCWFCG